MADGVELVRNHIDLEVVDQAEYVYGDRITVNFEGRESQDFERKLINRQLINPTAYLIEVHLSVIAKNPGLLLQRIKTGIQSNGHPFQQFGFVTQ